MSASLRLQAVLNEMSTNELVGLTYEQLQRLESALHHVEGWVRTERRSRSVQQK